MFVLYESGWPFSTQTDMPDTGLAILAYCGRQHYIAEVSKVKWTQDAKEMLKRAPFIVRPLAKRKIESEAKRKGVSTIDAEFVQSVRSEHGQ